MYNHLLRPCVLTGRCSLLPVVNNSGAICNSWKLDPSTLRFPLRGMLPFDKVTNAPDLYTTHTFRRTEVWSWFVCYHIGPFWATDRVATLCTRTALFKRDGVQHVGAQQAGKTTSSSFVFVPLPPYQALQMPPHFLPPLFSSYHLLSAPALAVSLILHDLFFCVVIRHGFFTFLCHPPYILLPSHLSYLVSLVVLITHLYKNKCKATLWAWPIMHWCQFALLGSCSFSSAQFT